MPSRRFAPASALLIRGVRHNGTPLEDAGNSISKERKSAVSLNISLITHEYVCQVSDRRFTYLDCERKPAHFEDSECKSVIFESADAYMLISYHGVGQFADGKKTDIWIVDTLTELRKTASSSKDMIMGIRDRATEYFRRSCGSFRHSFVLAGWLFTPNPRPIIMTISNYERFLDNEISRSPVAESKFTASWIRLRKDTKYGCGVYCGGLFDKVREKDWSTLKQIAQAKGAKPKDIVAFIVRAIRGAADRSRYIGKNCMSCFSTAREITASCSYHPNESSGLLYAPHYISTKGIAIRNVEIWRGLGLPPWRK